MLVGWHDHRQCCGGIRRDRRRGRRAHWLAPVQRFVEAWITSFPATAVVVVGLLWGGVCLQRLVMGIAEGIGGSAGSQRRTVIGIKDGNASLAAWPRLVNMENSIRHILPAGTLVIIIIMARSFGDADIGAAVIRAVP